MNTSSDSRAVSQLYPSQASYRWWETECDLALRRFDAWEVRRLIRFRLYPNNEYPRQILLSRSESSVDHLWSSLSPPERRNVDTSVSTHQYKVEQILHLSRTDAATPSPSPWGWYPNISPATRDARTIASDIDRESRAQFKTVPFEDWVHYSLGYSTESVEWLLQQHRKFGSLLSTYLEEALAAEADLYVEVEMYLRQGSHLAHHVLSQCLKEKGQLQHVDYAPVPLHERLNFVIMPIRELFKDEVRGLRWLLKRLSILEIHFTRKYHQSRAIDWVNPFDTKTPFLDDLFSCRYPQHLAQRFTNFARYKFASLLTDGLHINEPVLQSLTTDWHALTAAVEDECFLAQWGFDDLKMCVELLYNLNNYYSATAVLHGLQKFSPEVFETLRRSAANPSENLEEPASIFLNLLDSTDNYAAYRRIMQERPGLPFLNPHLAEGGTEALKRIFPLPEQ
ncbi:hypothetical protein AJ80_01610 [Polytolypa hystricis UAMH7299]|uniref:Ras-GEF domain-containing protein n=1 Tax=Polytolypa hystricis (strain UAMH7299) TaxID=1447883 RepID=A0A2B7YRM2_POLH7|nr:hypothetical protein AJ80_01610 [Polytolypa hystricis UAMH7299]